MRRLRPRLSARSIGIRKTKIGKALHYARHSAPLKSLSKQYEFGMVFFAVMGAVSLTLFGANSGSDAWMALVLSLSLILFACGSALPGPKMVSRIGIFNDCFGGWQF